MPSTFGSSLDIYIYIFVFWDSSQIFRWTHISHLCLSMYGSWSLCGCMLSWTLNFSREDLIGLRASATCLHCSGDVQDPANRRPTRHTPDPRASLSQHKNRCYGFQYEEKCVPIDSIPHGNEHSARSVHFPSTAMTRTIVVARRTCDMVLLLSLTCLLHQLPQKLKPKIVVQSNWTSGKIYNLENGFQSKKKDNFYLWSFFLSISCLFERMFQPFASHFRERDF